MKKAGVLNLMGLLLSLPADLLWIWVLGGTLWMGMSRLSIGQEGMTVQFDFQPQILPWLLLMLAALLLWLLGFIFSLRNTVRAFRCRLQKPGRLGVAAGVSAGGASAHPAAAVVKLYSLHISVDPLDGNTGLAAGLASAAASLRGAALYGALRSVDILVRRPADSPAGGRLEKRAPAALNCACGHRRG